MSERENELRIEGVVRASGYTREAPGKQFLGAIIECSAGTDWVIDYDEQSPFHAFADRRVLVSGEPCEPQGQHLGGIRYFRVSTMRLLDDVIRKRRVRFPVPSWELRKQIRDTTTRVRIMHVEA